MTLFRTALKPSVSPLRIGLRDPVITTGSCFAQAMGKRLSDHKMLVSENPFGTTYNPVSIHKALELALLKKPVSPEEWVENQGIWFHYGFHSSFSSADRNQLGNKLDTVSSHVVNFLQNCKVLIITYGTAWVFRLKSTGSIVANCHKMPGGTFQRELLREELILDSFSTFHRALVQINPGIQVILTVSPVRHLKDSLEGNSLSKAVLRTTCHTLCRSFGHVSYFPAFEIMLDDLRDYRFYKRDMIHPSEEAEDYIWDCFIDRYVDDETREFFQEWAAIRDALQHKPFHASSSAHQQFLRNTLRTLEELKQKIDVDKEVALVRGQILQP